MWLFIRKMPTETAIINGHFPYVFEYIDKHGLQLSLGSHQFAQKILSIIDKHNIHLG